MQNQYPSHDGNFHTDYLHGEVQQNLPAHYSACSSTIHPSPGPTSQENQALPATFTTASSQPLHSNSGAWNQPSPYGIASLYNNMQPAVLHNQLNQAWLNFGNITSVPVGNNYNGVSETPQRTERRQYETGMTAKYQGYYQPWTSCSSGPPGDLVAFQSTIDWSLPPTHYPQSDQKSELLPHAQLPYPQASPEPMTEGFIDTRQITTTDDDSDVHSGDQTTRFPYLGDTTSDHGDQSTVSISDTSDDSVAAVAPEVSEANQPVGQGPNEDLVCHQCVENKRLRPYLKSHVEPFNRKADLTRHIRTKHTARQFWPCEHCQCQYTRKDNLKAHMGRKHCDKI